MHANTTTRTAVEDRNALGEKRTGVCGAPATKHARKQALPQTRGSSVRAGPCSGPLRDHVQPHSTAWPESQDAPGEPLGPCPSLSACPQMAQYPDQPEWPATKDVSDVHASAARQPPVMAYYLSELGLPPWVPVRANPQLAIIMISTWSKKHHGTARPTVLFSTRKPALAPTHRARKKRECVPQ